MVLPKPALTSAVPGPVSHLVDLDGLRGIAVLAVMAYHFGAPFLSGGYLGVDVFFVISGFVVTRNLARLIEAPGWAVTFYGRRVSRLYPVLLCFLGALLPYWAVQGELDGAAVAALIGGLAMSYNVSAIFLGAELDGPLLLWSLAVEWHFYLLIPVLLLAGRRRMNTTTRALCFVGLAVLVAGARLWALTVGDLSAFDVYLSTWFRLDGLLLGSAAALVPPTVFRNLPHRRLVAFGLAGTVTAMVAGPHWGARAPITLGVIVPTVTVLVLGIIMSAAGRQSEAVPGPIGATLRTAPLLWAGRRSYSLYLWHYFVGVSIVGQGSEIWQGPVLFVIQVAVSLAATEISYRYLERPVRARINRHLTGDVVGLRSSP